MKSPSRAFAVTFWFVLVFIAGCNGKRTDAARVRGKTSDPAKDEFEKLVRQNAQDPTGFEIVVWGEKNGNSRSVRFRCKLVGVTPSISAHFPFRGQKGGDQVMLEEANVVYEADKIKFVDLQKTYQQWFPK